jgi:hypothetical protein
MPTKPRTLAGILRSRHHADREYNRTRRDPVVARIHGSARWQALRARVLRDEPLCREVRAPGADPARHAGGPRRPPGENTVGQRRTGGVAQGPAGGGASGPRGQVRAPGPPGAGPRR